MGVANGCGYRRQVWLVGEIYGCGYQDVGVISGYCCKEVYIIILKHSYYLTLSHFPYNYRYSSFLQQHSYFFVHFLCIIII